jgi:arylsulfatase B
MGTLNPVDWFECYQSFVLSQDLGYETLQNCPTNRGFDYFYGYYNGFIDYESKKYAHFVDLQENDEIVTDEVALDTNLHAGYLFETKAEEAIAYHASRFPKKPMFMYYAMQLVHSPYEAPQRFIDRCMDPSLSDDLASSDLYNFCAMNLMLDEAVANLTCSLKANGMNDNSILVIASDNGGDPLISGSSYPFRGAKGSYSRGGVSATAVVISSMIPEALKGTVYPGNMHITGITISILFLAVF